MIGHPAESRLIGFLDGSLADGRRRAVAAHLASCQRCRDIVQAYRTHRHALTAVTPVAPAALFDRVLATRASGGGVILPADLAREQRRAPFTRRHLTVGAMIAATIAMVVALTRIPLPTTAFQRGVDSFGATLERLWSSALNTDAFDGPPRLMARPDAPAAVLEPGRLRELTARYEARYYADGVLESVDSTTVLRIRRDGDRWRITYRQANQAGAAVMTAAALDARTLAPQTMTQVESYPDGRRGALVVSREYAMVGDTVVRYRRTAHRDTPPPPGTVRNQIDTLTAYRITPAAGAPLSFRDRGLRAVLMMAAPLDRHWLGALDGVQFLDNRRNLDHRAERISQSRRVRGRETLSLPIGEVDTWQVEWWRSYGVVGVTEFYRRSDGLLVAESGVATAFGAPELRLLSVSYP